MELGAEPKNLKIPAWHFFPSGKYWLSDTVWQPWWQIRVRLRASRVRVKQTVQYTILTFICGNQYGNSNKAPQTYSLHYFRIFLETDF